MPPPLDPPEKAARQKIDSALSAAGWCVQDRRDLNLGAGPGVAVREFQTKSGPADYLLFLGNQLVGVIEAKRVGTTLSTVESQTRAYAETPQQKLNVPIHPLPFLYESTGAETWFTNNLDPIARARAVFTFHQPAALKTWLDAELHRRNKRPGAPPAPTLMGRMRLAPTLNTAGMWPAQIRAVQNLEASLRDGKPRALIQMATGSGKTFTAISALYRLIKEGGAKRVLFLVDRGNLGRQALKEFQAYTTPDDGRKFTELYNVVNLTHNTIAPVNTVVITTIQRLYSMLKGEQAFDDSLEEGSSFTGHGSALALEAPPVVYNPAYPPEFFDAVVVDECHRSIYTLWRQVLEYFDASLIGLTATPARHTYAFFNKNVVSEYRHEHAVRDKVNVPFEVYELRTQVSLEGATVTADPHTPVGRRNRQTRAVRWETLDEDFTYAGHQLDRSVVVPDQIRTLVRAFKERLFTEIFPGRAEIPKTLIFAKSDDHAEDILRILREEWPLSNEQAVKITYKAERGDADPSEPSDDLPSDDATDAASASQPGTNSKKPGRKSASHAPETLIQKFRNSMDPRIAVTVDMIATGTDIKPLECVMFMRSVKSRALFEQMKGRGVRVMPDADFQAVTPGVTTKTHFVIVDCVGVMEEQKSDPPILRDRGIAFERLLELVRAGNRDEDVLSTLAGRLDRLERRLTPDQRQQLETAGNGQPFRTLVNNLLDAVDPEREESKAAELFQLEGDISPTEDQLLTAQEALREAAAAPLAHNPTLCNLLLEVRKAQDVLIDVVTLDRLTNAGPRADQALRYNAEQSLVSEFETFCRDHRDELDALQVLYNRRYDQRLTRAQLKALAAALQRPPRQWTPESLWAAYEAVERDRVRGSSTHRLWTDIVSLAKKALGIDDALVPFADSVQQRFDHWMAEQSNRGKRFTPEQQEWLERIRDRIAADLEMQMDDFDDLPFIRQGGLGQAWQLFGEELEGIVSELNGRLVG